MATSWVLTKELQAFRDQMDKAFPKRDKRSDGVIGDLAHQNESASGHNPDRSGRAEWKDGDAKNEVRAIDVDSDTGNPSVSMEAIVQHLVRLARAGKLTFIRYFIYNRRIWAASDDWVQRAYTGPSPHTEHLHLSGAFNQASDENAKADYRLTDLVEDDVTKAEFIAWMTEWAKSAVGREALAVAILSYDPGLDATGKVKPGGVGNPDSAGAKTNPTLGPSYALQRAIVSASFSEQANKKLDQVLTQLNPKV